MLVSLTQKIQMSVSIMTEVMYTVGCIIVWISTNYSPGKFDLFARKP